MPPTREQAQKELRRRAAVVELERREAQQPGLGGRIGQDLQERERKIQESIAATQAGEQGAIRGGFQQGGQAALAGLDIGGEVARAGFEALPQAVQQPLQAAGQFVGEKVIQPVVQAAGQLPVGFGGEGTIGQAIPQELAENPAIARDLEAALGIGAVVSPGAGLGLARKATDITGKALGKAGEKVVSAGKAQALKQKSDFATQLVAPRETTKFIEQAGAAGRLSETGALNKRVVAPTPREVNSAAIVGELDIDPNRSFLHNNNLIIKGIDQKAKTLIRELEDVKVFFPKSEVKARLSQEADNLIGNNPFIVGNPQLTVSRIKTLMEDIVDQNLATPAGLLKARKDIDRKLKEQTLTKGGATIFDTPAEKAVNQAIANMRQSINNFIAEKAPSVNVKQSLGEQSLLFEARDTIAGKAARENINAMLRLTDTVSDKVKLSGPVSRKLGLGIAAGETAVQRTFRELRGPSSKKVFGELLRAADKVIKLEKDAGIVRQLRADRAIVLELLKEEQE